MPLDGSPPRRAAMAASASATTRRSPRCGRLSAVASSRSARLRASASASSASRAAARAWSSRMAAMSPSHRSSVFSPSRFSGYHHRPSWRCDVTSSAAPSTKATSSSGSTPSRSGRAKASRFRADLQGRWHPCGVNRRISSSKARALRGWPVSCFNSPPVNNFRGGVKGGGIKATSVPGNFGVFICCGAASPPQLRCVGPRDAPASRGLFFDRGRDDATPAAPSRSKK